MGDLSSEIIAGVVVAILSGLGGFLIKSRFFTENFILPKAVRHVETQSYTHLSGKWHLYWLSYNPRDASRPVWMHGVQDLKVNKNRVEGTTELVDHPIGDLHYKVQGEVRGGRMIATDICIEDETEFASLTYPNLQSRNLLVGIYVGFDNLVRPTSAPAILSRSEMSADELNRALKHSTIQLIPKGEYISDSDLLLESNQSEQPSPAQ